MQSERSLEKGGRDPTYSSKILKARSTVSREALELCRVDVFLASPVRRYRNSQRDSPSIKLSKSAAGEPLLRQVVPKGIGCPVSLLIVELLWYRSEWW